MLRRLMFPLVALAALAVPRLATAQCSYSASPTIALSYDRTVASPISGTYPIAED